MTKVLDAALRLLARREYSANELIVKLASKGFAEADIETAISECQRLGYQCDLRFAEALCRSRIRQGYGPIAINQELHAKRVESELISNVLTKEQDNWLAYAAALWQKKYKQQPAASLTELQKRQRFLLYRGFPTEIINQIIKCI